MAKLDDVESGLSTIVEGREDILLKTPQSLPHNRPQTQASSSSPSILKHSPQSPAESKDGLPTLEEFEELVNAKAQLLRDGHDRERALKDLCVLSLDNSRVILYRDYMKMLLPGYEIVSEDWAQIRLHLEQYVQAESLWDKIRKGFGRNFSGELESHVVKVAASQAVIAEYEVRMLQELQPEDRRREIFDQVKKLLSSRYRLKILTDEEQDGSYAYSIAISEIKRFAHRMGMAVFGGYALVIPMLIMTLHPTPLTNLLTTTLFVLGVAIVLAASMTAAEGKDVITATAGYAAVLVVFVGAITTESVKNYAVVAGTTVGVMIGIPVLIFSPFLIIHLAHWCYQYSERKDEERESGSPSEERPGVAEVGHTTK